VPSGPVKITFTGVADDVWRIDALDGQFRDQLPGEPWSYTWNAVSGAASPKFVLRDFAGNTTTLDTGYEVIEVRQEVHGPASRLRQGGERPVLDQTELPPVIRDEWRGAARHHRDRPGSAVLLAETQVRPYSMIE
jgi:hypothetical protein